MAIRNFDDERQPELPLAARQFILRGHQFTIRPRVKPEAQALLEDTLMMASAVEVLGQEDEAIKLYLVPEDGEAWDAVRAADGDETLEMADIAAVMKHLLEVAGGHPTDAPGPASNGRAETPGTGGAASSQQEATPTA